LLLSAEKPNDDKKYHIVFDGFAKQAR
jgi:hypothetical protein